MLNLFNRMKKLEERVKQLEGKKSSLETRLSTVLEAERTLRGSQNTQGMLNWIRGMCEEDEVINLIVKDYVSLYNKLKYFKKSPAGKPNKIGEK